MMLSRIMLGSIVRLWIGSGLILWASMRILWMALRGFLMEEIGQSGRVSLLLCFRHCPLHNIMCSKSN